MSASFKTSAAQNAAVQDIAVQDTPDIAGHRPPLPDRALFRRGWRDGYVACLPFILVMVPFSILFGVVGKDAGLDILQVMAMSIVVIAGSAQFAAVALLQENAPILIILAASLAVNLRMAMYSAALQPHVGKAPRKARMLMAYAMVDQTFAVAVKTYEARPEMTMPEKIGYYFGCVSCICPLWYLGCFAGALMGQAIPPELSLDFAVPICFISVVAPMLRSLPHIAAALASSIVTVVFAGLPWNLALLIAAAVGMVVGAQVEYWRARRIAAQAHHEGVTHD
ncbi:AzlC family ABC transporter permease [Albirhodobacter sp. R86504]|uniref:AzlC family ABC transporter permease n=1 Tax=Albirhodobacter sp. R86504 TaxID=3093848 RepID=UPI00366D0332